MTDERQEQPVASQPGLIFAISPEIPPAESFGSFDTSTPIDPYNLPVAPPSTAQSNLGDPGMDSNPVQLQTASPGWSGGSQDRIQPQQASLAQSGASQAGLQYHITYPQPGNFNPAVGIMPAAPKVRAPIHFPLTRRLPVFLQFMLMLGYSLYMTILLMFLYLGQLHLSELSVTPLIALDGGPNWAGIFVTAALILLILPASSLLAGALFGSWRSFLVSLCSIAGGIAVTHYTELRFWSTLDLQNILIYALFPIAALLVGWLYDHRRHAAWWRSLLSMMAGSTLIVLGYLTIFLVVNLNTPAFHQIFSDISPAAMTIVIIMVAGFALIVGMPLVAFPIAIIEGVVHKWVVAVKKRV